jgi:segregation and condensation protein A
MENPVFHLSGVIKSRGETLDFTGPLSLILQLLSRNKIEARDISVSLILEQYLLWLDEMASLDLDIASEFVAMASHLAYIKTRTLLGDEQPEELEELISTLERLRATDAYVQIKALTGLFAEMYSAGAGYIAKPPEVYSPDNTYQYSHEKQELLGAMAAILERTAVNERTLLAARTLYPRPMQYPIDNKITEILSRVHTAGAVSVSALFAECEGRSETVAAFVAVLELCASGRVALSDDGERMTTRYEEENPTAEEDPQGDTNDG